jgi:hypothetical protein
MPPLPKIGAPSAPKKSFAPKPPQVSMPSKSVKPGAAPTAATPAMDVIDVSQDAVTKD